MDHLKNLLAGFTWIATWGDEPRQYIRPRGGFRRDNQKLKKDVRRVGENIKKAYEQHGKPVSEGRS